jgi:hypothetical protein
MGGRHAASARSRLSVRTRIYIAMTMTDSDPQQQNPEKDPDDWVTGEEPATGPQLSYLSTLAQQAGASVPEKLTKADASKLIDELQDKTGRGDSSG